ncbi:hypothetical protein CR105_03070 [Massilia eurypsychrophila]|uniref:Uncharacterized protein n=1 Tax=Massilia eurypsychrophila TaxID=1485217 RepID=A0A2G8TJ69_9BURK|nr:hypothetical protein [Massilia eurypsychrophila]PIL46087.1 hypothetical protein CR105_03070 [Massilia eurypsychrophila]
MPDYDKLAAQYGASDDDKYDRLAAKFSAAPKTKPFGQQLNDSIADVPRQLGLTARYGLEGLGDTFDAFVGNPLRTLASPVLGNKPTARTGAALADIAGLPQPRTAGERVVGDAARMVAGGGGMLGAASKVAGATTGMAQGVGRMLASNPAQQLTSAGAAGAAGGYTRETGGNDTSQMVASLAAGVATPFAVNGAMRAGQSAAGAARNMVSPRAPSPVQIDITINNAIERSGMNLSQLPAEVAQGIRADVSKAMQIGDDISPAAVSRLVDYRLTGATPNRAGLTLDPAVVTQQRNLAKLGINSKDVAAQQLGQMQNANDRQLTAGLNTLGANTADHAIAGGGKVMDALGQRNDRAKDIIGNLYQRARDTGGRSAALDPHAFTNRANNLLDDALLGGKLPADVRNLLNKAAAGEMPLTVDVAEQFKTRIGDLQRSTFDMAERKALGMVRSALDDAPLLPGQEMGRESIAAFNKARGMNRAWMGIVDKTPALQAVRDGIEPDKFVQQFIVGAGAKSNVMDVAMLKNSVKGNPEAMTAIKGQITSHLKARALNGAEDEVGNFSQSAYNKALNAIGDRKLALFFDKPAIDQMRAIGRVASYEQFQPAGSAVNNSNTAGTGMAALLDRIGSSAFLSKIPAGKLLADPLQNIAIGMQAKQSLNVPRALTDGTRMPQPVPRGLAMSPAALMGTEGEEERKRREAGLLFP